MIKSFIVVVVITFFAFNSVEKLKGRWESKPSIKGNVTGVVFKDSTFEGYVNKKPFVSGRYSFENNVFSFVDNGCEGKRGVYEVVFFSNDDSIRFVPISDSCTERKAGMSRLVMGRKK
jgi:hypothetical protein